MTKTLSQHDLHELARTTGRTPFEVLSIAQQQGWTINDAASPTLPRSTPLPGILNNSKKAGEYMRNLKQETINNLYKSDPLIRESINAQMAVDATRTTKEKPSIVAYDDQGKITGVTKSVVSGIHATGANQTEVMRAIKANIHKQLGVTQ
ncbi:hypothetical protein [Pseudomonas sp. NPDC079086]|uniref:hypothetical protein n=1 Tax=unclassified Pseudomonas TaxID=196821 RepID=UPI0037CAC8B7